MSEQNVVSANNNNQPKDHQGGSVNLGRHQAQCSICLSPYRHQIEEEFLSWHSPKHFLDLFQVSRDALYRHAHAFDLFDKRRRNVAMVLDKIIERVDWTPMGGSDILSAVKLLAKLRSPGQETDQVKGTSARKLLESMSKEEREAFVCDGSLPESVSGTKGTTPGDGKQGEKESQVTEAQRLQ